MMLNVPTFRASYAGNDSRKPHISDTLPVSHCTALFTLLAEVKAENQHLLVQYTVVHSQTAECLANQLCWCPAGVVHE